MLANTRRKLSDITDRRSREDRKNPRIYESMYHRLNQRSKIEDLPLTIRNRRMHASVLVDSSLGRRCLFL